MIMLNIRFLELNIAFVKPFVNLLDNKIDHQTNLS